jgi:hypothetical protein
VSRAFDRRVRREGSRTAGRRGPEASVALDTRSERDVGVWSGVRACVVNFLFDPTQTPHLRATELCVAFGVSPSAGSAKSREIMAIFQMVPLDPRWCLPSRLADNPLARMVEINGFVVDVRMLSDEVQAEASRSCQGRCLTGRYSRRRARGTTRRSPIQCGAPAAADRQCVKWHRDSRVCANVVEV